MNPDLARVSGVRVDLRLVRVDDAAYIHGLRSNPSYGAHLSPVTGTIQDQASWIASYKEREATGHELYFIIERKDGRPCGTVRLYEFSGGSFTWGSWILDEGKPAKAALDSAVLVYRTAFERLGLLRAVFDVRRDNLRTLAFHDRFGAARVRDDDLNVYYVYEKEAFYQSVQGLEQSLLDASEHEARMSPSGG